MVAVRRSVALGAAALLLVGCSSGGGSARPSASPSASVSPTPSAVDTGWALLHSAAERAQSARTGRYMITTTVVGVPDLAKNVAQRRGAFDRDAKLHELRIVPPRDRGTAATELVFFFTEREMLLRSPEFASDGGKPWRRMPAELVEQQTGRPANELLGWVPGVDAALRAKGPVTVRPVAGGSELRLALLVADVVDLLELAPVKRALTELPKQAQTYALAGETFATARVGSDGSLRQVSVDATAIVRSIARADQSEPELDTIAGQLEKLTYTIDYTGFGQPVRLVRPPAAQVGDFN